jgi:hypothetical protein
MDATGWQMVRIFSKGPKVGLVERIFSTTCVMNKVVLLK